MEYQSYDKLHSTLTFQSQSGKYFRYEINHRSDASRLSACISCLDDLQPGVSIWVVINPNLVLSTEYQHPEFATDEAKKHFSLNYF